jgi:hypothetical protein
MREDKSKVRLLEDSEIIVQEAYDGGSEGQNSQMGPI